MGIWCTSAVYARHKLTTGPPRGAAPQRFLLEGMGFCPEHLLLPLLLVVMMMMMTTTTTTTTMMMIDDDENGAQLVTAP